MKVDIPYTIFQNDIVNNFYMKEFTLVHTKIGYLIYHGRNCHCMFLPSDFSYENTSHYLFGIFFPIYEWLRSIENNLYTVHES